MRHLQVDRDHACGQAENAGIQFFSRDDTVLSVVESHLVSVHRHG